MARRITTEELMSIPDAPSEPKFSEPKPSTSGVVSTAVEQLKSLAKGTGQVMYPRKPIEEGFMRPTGPVVQAVQKFGRGYTGGIMDPVRKGLGISEMPAAESPSAERIGKLADLTGAVAGLPGKGAFHLTSFAARKIPAIAGKGVLPIATRLGIESGTFGGLHDVGRPPKEIAKSALKGAAIGAALPIGAKGIAQLSKPVRKLGTAFAGIFPESVKQIKRVGFERVADPAKREGGYFKKIFPRIEKNFNNLMKASNSKTKNFLQQHGVKPKSIKTIINKGWNNVNKIYDDYGKNLGVIVDKIKAGADLVKKEASKKFDLAFNKSKIDKIDVKPTYYKLRKDLTQLNIIDEIGNPASEKYGNPTIDGLVRIYNNMRSGLVTKKDGKDIVTGFINKAQYNQYKLQIEALRSNVRATNRYVDKTVRSLRNDAKNSMPGLKEAMTDYAKAMDLEDKLYTSRGDFKLNENFLRKKWDMNTIREMNNIDKQLLPKYKFFDDLNKFKAAEDVSKKVSDIYTNPIKIDELLGLMKQYRSPQHAKIDRLRDIFKNFEDKEILDDALAHYLAKDIYQEVFSTGFMGAAGMTRKGLESATKAGLKGREFYKKTLDPTIKKLLMIKE